MNESDLNSGKRVKGFIYIIIIYIIAIFISLIVGTLLNSLHPILIILLADISATLFIFVISTISKNSSFYDPYWSVAPAVISIYLLFNSLSNNINLLYQIIILSLVLIWSIRLTYNWARLWQGLDDEDWRYTNLRVEKGKSFWLANLIGIHLMPTIVVFLGCLSLYPIFSINRSSFGYIEVIALSITLFAIIIETVSDQQLYQFIRNRENSTEIIKKGLWKYSRHPNYFGEILFWWSLYLFALITELSFWWMIIGPLSITILFYVLSIPMMEERNLSRKPTYLEYKESVSKLLPWFPKKKTK